MLCLQRFFLDHHGAEIASSCLCVCAELNSLARSLVLYSVCLIYPIHHSRSNHIHLSTMKSLLVSVFLSFLLLASPGEAARRTRNLDKALRDIGCNLYADFIRKYPIDEFKQKNITVFAPDNDSVRRYLKENPDRPVRGGSTTRQSQAAINQAKNKNNVSKGAGGSPPFKGSSPKGSVLSTGSGGTSGAKIKKPKPPGSSKRDLEGRREQNYVGTIGAGGGVKTKVLAEAEQFDNGEIFKISR